MAWAACKFTRNQHCVTTHTERDAIFSATIHFSDSLLISYNNVNTKIYAACTSPTNFSIVLCTYVGTPEYKRCVV